MTEAPLVLYQYGGSGILPSLSPPCLKVALALRALQLPHEVVDVSPLRVGRVSPSGRVPALRMGSRTLVDSCAILDELQRLHPDAGLWPREPSQRTVDRLWDHFVTDTLYWAGLYQRYLVPENRAYAWDLFFGRGPSLRRVLLGPLIVRAVRARARAQGIGRRERGEVEAQHDAWLGMIDDALEPGPFLQGRDAPGRGDLAVASYVAQLIAARELPILSALLRTHARLEPHCRRVLEGCGLTV